MNLLKTFALVTVAAAGGALVANELDKRVSTKLGLDKTEKAGTRAAVKVGYTAASSVVLYGLLNAVV